MTESSLVDSPPQTIPPKSPRSAKQAESSRRNGQKGKGPVTLAGRQKSGRNATRVGLFCKTIPVYRYPLYYSKADVSSLAADVAAQLGCKSEFTYALAESVAIDTLRLRHIHALEHAMLDPDIERNHELERALHQQRGHCIEKTEEDLAAIQEAATKAREALNEGKPFQLAPYEFELISDALWSVMVAPRCAVEEARRELDRVTAQMKDASPEDMEWLRDDHKRAGEDLQQAQERLKTGALSQYGIETQDDLEAMLRNAKPAPSEIRPKWAMLLGQLAHDQAVALRQRQDGRLRIESLRRDQLLQSLNGIERLTQLADYAARIQRHMEKTVAMIREMEGSSAVLEA